MLVPLVVVDPEQLTVASAPKQLAVELLWAGSKPFLDLSGSPDLVIADVHKARDQNRRAALIIGVKRYPSAFSQLAYTISDAESIADQLSKLGVKVTLKLDASKIDIEQTLHSILAALGPNDTFYFYFAGHGWSRNGETFLGSADITMGDSQVSGGLSVEELKSSLKQSKLGAAFAFLDVCRNEIQIII